MRYDHRRMASPAAAKPDVLGEAPLLHGASEQAITQLRDTARETRLAARDWLSSESTSRRTGSSSSSPAACRYWLRRMDACCASSALEPRSESSAS